MFYFYILLLILEQILTGSCNYKKINLPRELLPYYFTSNKDVASECLASPDCPFKAEAKEEKYWGYEYGKGVYGRYSSPDCPGDHKGWVTTKKAQQDTFYDQADFGYIKKQLQELKLLCEPLFLDDSSLECTDHLRYCHGRNIMINFTNLLTRSEAIRYQMDVLGPGDIGGFCDFKQHGLDEHTDHISALQSWGPELRHFTKFKRRPIASGDCDLLVKGRTYIMKIDAINMYHHFCDFFNLYASLHMNYHDPNQFSRDVNILIWETYTYASAFQDTFGAFTKNPIWNLKTFAGKTVCFSDVVFPLLPRMIFGLYYNTPLIYGCQKSGLFHSFSKFILHRLKIPKFQRENKKIRITFLSRDTKYRRIINEDELMKAILRNDDYEVVKVVFNADVPFKKQLEIIAHSDVLIGIHGAGLTHLLFLPDWATVFEIYNCEDANCYADLARLRGVNYITWKDISKITSDSSQAENGAAYAKFANYEFESEEFIKLLKNATDLVRKHPDFKHDIEHLSKYQSHDEL